MNGSLLRKWSLVSLCSAWVLGVGCAGDPPKRTDYDADAGAGGEAGETGSNVGGSNLPANNAGEPNVGGAPGAAGEPSAGGVGGVAGAPTAAGQGGLDAVAGTPNEPTAGAPNLPQCEGALTFANSTVEQQVRDAIALPTGEITSAAVANLTTLVIPFTDGDIDLGGVECLQSITTLDFSGGGGQEPLSLLASLPNLRKLDLHDGYWSAEALDGLDQLTQLTSLDLSSNYITSLDVLTSLVNLQHLNLADVDSYLQSTLSLEPLVALTKLESLDLSSLVLDDLSPLASLPQLQELSLNGDIVASVSIVEDLTSLTALDLTYTQITALPDLSALTNLTHLTISNNTIANLTPLGSLTTLTELKASGMSLTSLASIAPLIALTNLDVSYNSLTDITVLGALPALSVLNLSTNPNVTSLQPLVDSSYIGAGDELNLEQAGSCDANFITALEALLAKVETVQNYCGVQ